MFQLAPTIDEAKQFIQSRWPVAPRAGIVLGSGLGGFADQIQADQTIPYHEIPHFPKSTAIGHRGQLVCGHVAGIATVAMQGRFHVYEGHDLSRITLPVRVMAALGIELLVVSNASGGVNPSFAAGDIMVIDDHINLMFENPLIGVNDDRLGPRFPDMSSPYDPALIDRALETARREGFVCHRGVYAAMTGPTYETRAEYRMLRQIGADAAGMSTVPEVIVAVHAGLRVLALSAITNVCKPDVLTPTDGAEVVEVAAGAEHKMRSVVLGVLRVLSSQ